MNRLMCKSKIHRATVTEANLNYNGSITIDKSLMDAADLYAFEQVHVVNVNNGNRFITYVIEGEKDSGVICLNGAAARLVMPNDLIIIVSYAEYSMDELRNFHPSLVFVDHKNQLLKVSRESLTTGLAQCVD